MKTVIRPEAEMKDSGTDWIGEIPNSWNVNPLYACLYEINQKNSPIVTTNILSLTNTDGVIPYSERGNQGNKSKENFEEYKVVYHNNIVANSMNILIGSVGLSQYEGCVSPVYYVYAAKPQIDIRYMNYLFQMEPFQKRLRQFANGILEIRLRVSSHDILHQKVAVPNYGEQQAIADYLDETCSKIDEIIAEAKASIDEYKELKQSVIFETVTKGLDKNIEMKDSGIKWIGKIPNDAKLISLKHLVSKTITDGTHQTPDYESAENGSPFLSSKDISSGKIDFGNIKYITKKLHEELHKNVSPQINDILLAKNGTTGIAALVETDAVFDIYVTLALIRPDVTKVLPKYLLHGINCYVVKHQFDEHLLGIGVPNLHLNVIRNTKVIIHNKNQQKEIADFLDKRTAEIDSLITEKQSLIADLEAYKKSLIYEVVTGKRKVV